MMYILDDLGYIQEFSSNHISCNNKSCTEYKGTIPSGYSSLEEWAINANIRAYKIVNGNLSYDETRDRELQEEYKQGIANEVVITSTNNAPDNTGNWVLIDKEFTPEYIYSTDTTYITRTKLSSADIRIRRSGHSISISVEMKANVQINDTNVVLGTLNLSAIGLKSKKGNDWVSGFTDDGNCMVMIYITESTNGTPQITASDIIPDSYISTGKAIGFSHTFVAESIASMDDSKCNKFYWKRKGE